MHRLSSAVELTSYWRSPTKEPQQGNVQEEEEQQHVIGEDEVKLQQQPTTDRSEEDEVAVRRK